MLVVLNDLHIGTVRSSGVTLASQLELKQSIHTKFKALLPSGHDLMLLGDVFDSINVPIIDVLDTYFTLKAWCSANPLNKLWLIAGNHDLAKSSNVLSSFDFLCALLVSAQVLVVKEPIMTPYGYVIPHLQGQALFDEALANVPQCEVLFLHCNVDNKFAAQSDMSLNISKEQIEATPANSIVVGHEHKARRIGKVTLPGCQIATSCADWIGQRGKMYATVDNGTVSLVPCPVVDEFTELDWQALLPTAHKFIRVTGTATAEQAAAVVTAISKFRQASQAYVITNAVSITREDDGTVFEDALDGVHAFDVMSALREIFTLEEMTVLEGLQNAQ